MTDRQILVALADPGLFAADSFWARYPYAPPCFFGTALCAGCLLATFYGLPETVGPRSSYTMVAKTEEEAEQGPSRDAAAADAATEEEEADDPAERSALLAPAAATAPDEADAAGGSSGGGEPTKAAATTTTTQSCCFFCSSSTTRTVVLIKLVISFFVVGDDNTFPLWTAAPRSAGGLGFQTSQTGAALALMGATVVFAQLFIYPPGAYNC